MIALLGIVLFVPFLGQVHLFDWDEINFAEAAREMLVSKNYMRVQIDFQPFWEKPPLFIWMQALSMAIFGINEFAARLPNAVFGIITLCTLFYIGKRVVNERMAWLWVLFYAGTWLSFFYFKTAIIDPVFNFFILISFFQVFLIRFGNRKILPAILAGFFLGLAVLTKGPVAILIAELALIVYLIWNKGFWGLGFKHVLILSLVCALTSFSWFGVDIFHNGWWFTKTFIAYQIRLFSTGDAGHGQPFYYHPIVLLIGCFPASLFLFQSRKQNLQLNLKAKDFKRWMWILFWVVLILFSIVKTKIVHYSSLCYFPITFIAALEISKMDLVKPQWKNIFRGLFLGLGIVWSLLLILLPIIGKNKTMLIPYIKDEFAIANLQAEVTWSYWLCSIGIAYLLVVILVFVKSRYFFERSMVLFLILNMLFIPITMLAFTPKIEAYSQAAAIDFYKSFSGKDCYIIPMGFKSYAHLFYARKKDNNSKAYEQNGIKWLLEGDVDKPIYFICKINYAKNLDKKMNLIRMGAKNGFVFYKRNDQ